MKRSALNSGTVTLVVGDRALAGLIERGGEGTVVSVDHYLDALGELGGAELGEVGALIGRLDPMAASLEATIKALRELADGVRMILVIDAGQEPEAQRAVALGFDDYVVRPFEESHIWSALGTPEVKPLLSVPTTISEVKPSLSTPTSIQAQKPVPTKVANPSVQEIKPQVVEVAAKQDETPAEANEAEIVSAVDGTSADDRVVQAPLLEEACIDLLGDVDLVEQLLRDREGLKAKALRLMSQRLGGEGLSWSAEPEAGGQSCEVKFGGQKLGYLTGQTLEAGELKVYAAWLARWLMLERQLSHLNELALKDELTGVWNRRYFNRFLASMLNRAKMERFRVTVMIYDIDDFKDYNDAYGHAAGDEILRETAALMGSVIRDHDIVARIGGDEFAVIFWDAEESRKSDSEHPQSVSGAARRFRKAICDHRFPKLADEAPGTLTISGGLASYPWDGATVDELMEVADHMLLESKRKGKNAMTFGPGAMRICQVNDNGDTEPRS